jgi:hypothetical protein
VCSSESLAFPASSCALAVADRAFEVFLHIAEPAEARSAAHGGSPIFPDGLPLANPARSDVAITP